MAVPLLEQCVRKDAGNAVYQYHLGMAYAKAGDKAKAKRALEQALVLSPAFPGSEDARKLLGSL